MSGPAPVVPVGGPGLGVTGVGVGSPDTGIRIAPGDPDRVDGALSHLLAGAGTFDTHAQRIQSTAHECTGQSWHGEAAASYTDLSDLVALHFRNAAQTLREASGAMGRYAAELRRCKHEGMVAVDHAAECMRQITIWNGRLTAAIGEETNAGVALGIAEGESAAAHALGPLGTAMAHSAQTAIGDARRRLTHAQTAERTARRALRHEHEQLTMWQARGRRAWEDSVTAAEHLTGSLAPLAIQPPPLAGLPAIPMLSPTFHGKPAQSCEEPGMTVNAESNGEGKGSGTGARKLGISALGALLAGLARILGRAAEDEAGSALEGAGSRATSGGAAEAIGKGDLSAEQAANYARYTRKLPSGAGDTTIERLPDGSVRFSTDVPGRVPGSYARYIKTVDSSGNTVAYVKDTYDPAGKLVSSKDKFGPKP